MNICHEYRWQKGISRYYKVILQRDLLNDWVITCVWGGIGTRLGNIKHHPFSKKQEALDFIKTITKKRKRRGYEKILLTGKKTRCGDDVS